MNIIDWLKAFGCNYFTEISFVMASTIITSIYQFITGRKKNKTIKNLQQRVNELEFRFRNGDSDFIDGDKLGIARKEQK